MKRKRKDDLPEGCRWRGRGRKRKVVCTGEHAGLGYIPRQNPCGVSYEQFRSPWEFVDAFEMVGGRGGAQYAPSKKKVLRMLGKLKRDEYARHQANCAGAGAVEREEPSAYDWSAPEDWGGLAAIPSGRALPVELGKSLPLVETEDALERIAARQPQARLDKLPKHIEPFGRYMQLAAAEPVTPRRLVKAYVITRSSVQRQGLPKATVCRAFPDYRPLPRHADPRMVRPEDAMARLLFSEPGARYLDAAAAGRFDAAVARELADRMQCFGLIDNPQGLYADMRYAATSLAPRTDAFAAALKAPGPEYWKYVRKNVKGIAESKAGFIAALLGRGDIPTFDARERDLWLRYAKQRKAKNVSWSTIERLRDRFQSFPMELPEGLEPFKVHLVHHALWDAFAAGERPSKTSHGALIRSMQFASAT